MPDNNSKLKLYLKVFGAAVLGAFIGSYLSAGVSKGLELAFPEDDLEFWGILLWGEHWFVRLVVSLLSTALGGFVAGLVVPDNSKVASTLSAIPTVLIFAGGGSFLLYSLNTIQPPSFGSWFTILAITLLSIPVAWNGASWGSAWRKGNEHLFGIKGRPLGIHWSHYFWLWLPYYLLIGELAFTFYFLVRLTFSDDWRFVFILGRILTYFAFTILGYGMLEGLKYLTQGHHLGLRRTQVAGKVLLSIVVFPAIAIGLRTGGFYLLSVQENLPSWLYTIFRFFTGA